MRQLKILLLTLVLAMTCGVASAQKGMQGQNRVSAAGQRADKL